jgi:hypothetical protein
LLKGTPLIAASYNFRLIAVDSFGAESEPLDFSIECFNNKPFNISKIPDLKMHLGK